MLGLVSAIRALTAVLSDILEQITIIAVNTTPADPEEDTTPGNG